MRLLLLRGAQLVTAKNCGYEGDCGYKLAATDFLTEARLRGAKPKSGPYKLRNGGGLYLLVAPTGAKQWRLRYRVSGRESMVSLGTYPATSLKAARSKRANLRSALEAHSSAPAMERTRASEASGRESLLHIRGQVERGWEAAAEILGRQGQQDLAWRIRRFTEALPPVRTDRELLREAAKPRERQPPQQDLTR